MIIVFIFVRDNQVFIVFNYVEVTLVFNVFNFDRIRVVDRDWDVKTDVRLLLRKDDHFGIFVKTSLVLDSC